MSTLRKLLDRIANDYDADENNQKAGEPYGIAAVVLAEGGILMAQAASKHSLSAMCEMEILHRHFHQWCVEFLIEELKRFHEVVRAPVHGEAAAKAQYEELSEILGVSLMKMFSEYAREVVGRSDEDRLNLLRDVLAAMANASPDDAVNAEAE